MPLDVVPRVPFMQQHPRFLMFSKPDRWDWLYEHLVNEGYRARPLFVTRSERGGSRILYLIEHGSVAPLAVEASRGDTPNLSILHKQLDGH